MDGAASTATDGAVPTALVLAQAKPDLSQSRTWNHAGGAGGVTFPTRLERSKVRVSFHPGPQPHPVTPSPPSPTAVHCHIIHTPILSPTLHHDMADQVAYNRQISTESGWDNPFRPDGDLSREADEIVSLIKGGKPFTPTALGQASPQLAASDGKDGALESPQTKISSPVQQSTPKVMNGTKNGSALTETIAGAGAGVAGQVEVSRAPPQEPQQAEHVTIKKKPKCECCIIQ